MIFLQKIHKKIPSHLENFDVLEKNSKNRQLWDPAKVSCRLGSNHIEFAKMVFTWREQRFSSRPTSKISQSGFFPKVYFSPQAVESVSEAEED